MTRRPTREAQGVKNLITSLRAKGWKCWRIETRQASGVPDIVAADPDGRLVWIECKRAIRRKDGGLRHEKMRPAQVAFMARCIRENVPCAVAIVGGEQALLFDIDTTDQLKRVAKGSIT